MLRRSIPVAVVAVVALVLCVPNAAAQPREGVPVAGPTPSGAELFVYDQRRSLCGGVRFPEQRSRSETCGGGVPRLRLPVVTFDALGPGRRAFVWGAVVPEVMTVEVVFSNGDRISAATSDGAAYRGRYAGRLRFFLMETRERPGVDPVYVRLLDAAGELLAAHEVGEGAQLGRTVLVDRGRVGAERWTLTALRQRRLLPLPGDEERIVGETCVDFEYSGEGRLRGPSLSARSCADPDGAVGPWALSVDTACRAIGLSAIGLAPPDANRLVAVLGDGRRVRVPLRALPARFGDQRAFALALGARTALRRLVANEDGRQRVLAGGIAPGTTNCPDSTTGIIFDFFPGFPNLDDEPRFGPGGPALQVRDEGVLLCATIGLPSRVDCSRPPVDEEGSRIFWHRADAGTYAAGVLTNRVASVVLVWDGGERQQVATTADGPYAGRYQGQVRFFTASLPGRRTLRAVELLDAGGRRLERLPIFAPAVFDPAPVAVLRGAGGFRLGAGVLRAERFGRVLCLQLSRAEFDRDPLGCGGPGPRIDVSCRPRGMQLYGRMREGVRNVRVETDRGAFDARSARLPARLGVTGRVFLVQLPAAAGPRRIVFEGRRTTRRRLRLPAAASQCGYGTVLH